MLHPKLSDGLITSLLDFSPGASVPLAAIFMQYADEAPKLAYEQLLRDNPLAIKMLEDKYLSPDYDFDYLGSLPEGTLGKEAYHYFIDNGLNPDLLRKAPSIQTYRKRGDDVGYWRERLLQLHDLWHILTGYDTSRLGEVKVVSFTVAQLPGPYPSLIIGTRPLQQVLLNPHNFIPMMDALVEGWKLGRQAKPLMGTRWEEMWECQLEDLRREYNLISTNITPQI